MSAADRLAHVAASYVRTPAPVMSDALWQGLFVPLPDQCQVHHCWVDQCPAGSHSPAPKGGER
ncbi:hypothetical protein BG418_18440 [Streptomyces sp. CBMA152]|nr:hypothetical protein [Streptomyces sp. CBMA152]